MGKIMCKLKHNYNAFPELQTKFFHKQCVIWSFLPSFNELHNKLHIFKISGSILEQLAISKKLEQELSSTKLFQILRDKSKVSSFLREQRYSDACHISSDFDGKCKCSESRQVSHRKSHWEAK